MCLCGGRVVRHWVVANRAWWPVNISNELLNLITDIVWPITAHAELCTHAWLVIDLVGALLHDPLNLAVKLIVLLLDTALKFVQASNSLIDNLFDLIAIVFHRNQLRQLSTLLPVILLILLVLLILRVLVVWQHLVNLHLVWLHRWSNLLLLLLHMLLGQIVGDRLVLHGDMLPLGRGLDGYVMWDLTVVLLCAEHRDAGVQVWRRLDLKVARPLRHHILLWTLPAKRHRWWNRLPVDLLVSKLWQTSWRETLWLYWPDDLAFGFWASSYMYGSYSRLLWLQLLVELVASEGLGILLTQSFSGWILDFQAIKQVVRPLRFLARLSNVFLRPPETKLLKLDKLVLGVLHSTSHII